MDPDAVAKAFVEHYYSLFDSNRAALANLYQEGSMLTFEGQKIQGSQNIVAKLTSLPFQQCQHSITTVDCQPSGPAGGMLVFVSGNLQLAGEQHALKFSQSDSLRAHSVMLCFDCVDFKDHDTAYRASNEQRGISGFLCPVWCVFGSSFWLCKFECSIVVQRLVGSWIFMVNVRKLYCFVLRICNSFIFINNMTVNNCSNLGFYSSFLSFWFWFNCFVGIRILYCLLLYITTFSTLVLDNG
ncbi:putative nuclear transport factor 2, NTF2-like domain-containing protein [Rosa chinensis]|uniref:Putative nuclear transport factor 2, NTF2-like domain-containing protein n=1 Tax=Rosa chinensis TaxID=74649 RepID=A0A2P6R0F0_ROSCH|nr:putative nuclear transport factor 2, NTF2-like domain-containing protein [Rosa chinensis]